MEQAFGKIKNGKLIIAPKIVIREGDICIDNISLYKEKGYKKLLYTKPSDNKPGFDLVSSWEEREDFILQKWEYKEFRGDYSDGLLVAIRNFDYEVNLLKNELRRNYKRNKGYINKIFAKEELIKGIYTYKDDDVTTEQLLNKLAEYRGGLIKFFKWLKMEAFFEKRNIVIKDAFLIDKRKTNDEMKIEDILDKDVEKTSDDEKEYMQKCIIPLMYFKCKLSRLYLLEKNETISNKVAYNMAFIYLFTLFDEALLKIIRLVCMHEKRWLFGTENICSEEIMKCDTVEELQEMLVNKKVNQLAWGSYEDKIIFLKERGVKIDEKHRLLFDENILLLSLKRNVLVHNGGVWNKNAIDMLKGTRYYRIVSVGKDIDRTYESFKNASGYITIAVKYLYDQLCDKFNLLAKY